MHPFSFSRPTDLRAAIEERVRNPHSAFIAGGTDLLGLMKDGATLPSHLLDINALHGMTDVMKLEDESLRIGALARMSDVAAHTAVREAFPVVSESLLLAASGQLRNMATIGGNLMQRTRCPYFRDADNVICNKRVPGSGCAALHGLNRGHAIFGWSEACVATHPSDFAVALAALDASVHVAGPRPDRVIPITRFHRLPGVTPEKDNVLEPGEVIVAVQIPARAEGHSSHYLKVRDRQSYEFALVSTAAAVAIRDHSIVSARLAMGGVAHKPWRLNAAEAALRGISLDDNTRLRSAIRESFAEAHALEHNGFKIELAERCVLRALQVAGERV